MSFSEKKRYILVMSSRKPKTLTEYVLEPNWLGLPNDAQVVDRDAQQGDADAHAHFVGFHVTRQHDQKQ